MTSKKGSLWKTSWNRGRGTPIPDTIGDMAFFQDFNFGVNLASYATGVNSSLGLSLPFWFAAVGIRAGGQQVQFSGANRINPLSDADLVKVSATVGTTVDVELAVAGDDFVSASIVVAEATTLGYSIKVYFEDQVLQIQQEVLPYFPGAALLRFLPSSLPGALHGFAGGPGVPTPAERHAWFQQLRALLTIQPIPGKTTHLYSAGAVYPTVPALLTNLGTDATQDLTLVTFGAPTPANVLIPVRFAY
jgi:hypothetical protein